MSTIFEILSKMTVFDDISVEEFIYLVQSHKSIFHMKNIRMYLMGPNKSLFEITTSSSSLIKNSFSTYHFLLSVLYIIYCEIIWSLYWTFQFSLCHEKNILLFSVYSYQRKEVFDHVISTKTPKKHLCKHESFI